MGKKKKATPARAALVPIFDDDGELIGHLDPSAEWQWIPIAPATPATLASALAAIAKRLVDGTPSEAITRLMTAMRGTSYADAHAADSRARADLREERAARSELRPGAVLATDTSSTPRCIQGDPAHFRAEWDEQTRELRLREPCLSEREARRRILREWNRIAREQGFR